MENNCTESKKDQGDTLKKVNRSKNTREVKEFMRDRGDSNTKTSREKSSDKNAKQDDVTLKTTAKSPVIRKKNIVEDDKPVNRLLDITEKKRIRDKYTIKLNTLARNRKAEAKSRFKELQNADNDSSKKRNDDVENKDKLTDNTKAESTKTDKELDSKEKLRKRPVIRTITSKNDASKVYKAVTFTEQKRNAITPLQIKIPTDTVMRGTKLQKPVQSYDIESKASEKVKIKNKNDKRKSKQIRDARGMSPDSLFKGNGSPPTEVAKWSLNSDDKFTKPYYEAWVNTTLAAISRTKKKDKLAVVNKNIIQTFKKFLEQRPVSPELVYENYLDERYTGRIKVNHRQ